MYRSAALYLVLLACSPTVDVTFAGGAELTVGQPVVVGGNRIGEIGSVRTADGQERAEIKLDHSGTLSYRTDACYEVRSGKVTIRTGVAEQVSRAALRECERSTAGQLLRDAERTRRRVSRDVSARALDGLQRAADEQAARQQAE